MGVILRRLGMVGLIGLALYATYFMRRPSVEPVITDARNERFDELGIRRTQAMMRWSALAAREAAVTLIANQDSSGAGPRIATSGFPPGATSPAAESMLRDRWNALGAPASSKPFRVLLYNEATYDSLRAQIYPYSGAMLVPSGPETVCVAITHATLNASRHLEIVKSALDQALAPCLLLAAFGAPGNGMRTWLTETRYAAAQSNAWLSRPGSFVDGGRRPPWEWEYDDSWSGAFEITQSSILLTVAGPPVAMALVPPYQMGSPALHCLNGDEVACLRGVLEPVHVVDNVPEDLTYSWVFGRGIRRSILDPHPVGAWFLSDLIRLEGRARFVKFWKSDQPIETSFREVYGRDLGTWTRHWGFRQWRESDWIRELNASTLLGVTIRPSWPLLVVLWTAVAVLIAAWTARRRQVTT
jgi:hypothetical protein